MHTINVELTGVISKKAVGALRMLRSNFLCNTFAAHTPPYAYKNALKRVKT